MSWCCDVVRQTPKESPSGAAQESSDPLPAAHVTLTDGWYSIPAVLDVPLLALVRKQAITVGSKLFMYGAEFTGTPQASPPLQVLVVVVGDIACGDLILM